MAKESKGSPSSKSGPKTRARSTTSDSGTKRAARDSGGVTNLASALKGIDFPCSRKELVKHAQSNNASKAILDDLKGMPEQDYGTMAEVMKGFGSGRSGDTISKSPSKKG